MVVIECIGILELVPSVPCQAYVFATKVLINRTGVDPTMAMIAINICFKFFITLSWKLSSNRLHVHL